MAKDYYEILGVSRTATKDEIKKAFHKIAHKHHPDKNGGDDTKFKEANEAYQTLSDDTKRKNYDQFGNSDFAGSNPYGQGGFSGGGFDFTQGFDMNDLGDIFGDFFGGSMRSNSRPQQRKGRDLATEVRLTFKEAIFGIEKIIRIKKNAKCGTCNGSGAENANDVITCTKCKGQGRITKIRKTIIGQIQQVEICDSCDGIGQEIKKKCKTCKGSGSEDKYVELTIKIPPGSSNGDTLRLSGGGEYIRGGVPGDLYLNLNVENDKNIKRNGYDLYYELKIKLTDALLGTEKTVELIDSTEKISIEAGTQDGSQVILRGKGVPNVNGLRGNAIVILNIEIPSKLSKKSKELIEELRNEGM